MNIHELDAVLALSAPTALGLFVAWSFMLMFTMLLLVFALVKQKVQLKHSSITSDLKRIKH